MPSESAASRKARETDNQSPDRIGRGWTSQPSDRKNRRYQ